MKHSAIFAPFWATVALLRHVDATPARPPAYNNGWAVGRSIHTSSGRVEGHPAADALEVSEYLGIPYALPPTGNLRFQPPIKYKGSSIINGTDFGFSCMEAGPINGDWPHSEDCLTLNVWTKPQSGDKKKAILVWVYGGGYVAGSSRDPIYNGKHIANQDDVLVISLKHFSYRINVFGFPGNPTSPSNLGLLDMRLAMEWIRDNAGQFGGDVNRITIFGQSAGAGMADFYSYAYVADPIAHGFILQSATVFGFPPLTSAAASTTWKSIAESAGCVSNSEEPLLITECMRTRPTTEIMAAIASVGASFGPVEDGVIVYTNYTSLPSAEGAYLIGNTQNESGFFRLLEPNHTDAYWQNRDEDLYTCAGAKRIAQTLSRGSPTWRYRYFGDFPNLAISTDPPSGAYHTAELPILFDTVSTQSQDPSTPQQVAIGKYMRGAWAAFAKDPAHGLVNYADGWPLYESSRDTLVRLAYDNQTGANLALGGLYDGPCQLLQKRLPARRAVDVI